MCGEAVVRACVSSKTHYVTWTQKRDSPCQRSVWLIWHSFFGHRNFEPQITALALEVHFRASMKMQENAFRCFWGSGKLVWKVLRRIDGCESTSMNLELFRFQNLVRTSHRTQFVVRMFPAARVRWMWLGRPFGCTTCFNAWVPRLFCSSDVQQKGET